MFLPPPEGPPPPAEAPGLSEATLALLRSGALNPAHWLTHRDAATGKEFFQNTMTGMLLMRTMRARVVDSAHELRPAGWRLHTGLACACWPSGETSWERPLALGGVQSDWTELVDASTGKVYFYNQRSKVRAPAVNAAGGPF